MKPAVLIIPFLLVPLPICGQDVFQWDEVTDFTEIRNEYGWRDDYCELCEVNRPLQEMVDAVNVGDPEAILAVTIPWLMQCPIDIQAHIYALVAYSNPEPREGGRVHFEWADGLIKSVMASGDGKTPETAYVTISIAEERAVLVDLELKTIKQVLVGNPRRDVIIVEDIDGERYSVWFNPAAHFYRLTKWAKELDLEDEQ